MEKTNIKIMEIKNNNINKNANEQVISSLATELAKVQLLEVSNIIDECECETFEDIYNKLGLIVSFIHPICNFCDNVIAYLLDNLLEN